MMCVITPSIAYPVDFELEELRRQLRQNQIEEEKARIRKEIARLKGQHCPPNFQWALPCTPKSISIQDVLDKVPRK